MNDFDHLTGTPSLNLTVRHDELPIYASTPLVAAGKAPSSASSSIFLPVTENSQHSEQLIKLNEDLCLLGLFDYVPSTINLDQTLSLCRQLVKNYNKLSHEKHLLYEKLKKSQNQHEQTEKRQDTIRHDLDRLQTNRERLTDNIQDSTIKIDQLTQTLQTKEKEIRRLNQIFAQQTALAKHQYRNIEKQLDKFKERVLNYEKNRMSLASIDYSWPLSLNESIPSFDSSPELLLKKICHDYDQKQRLLMIENEQLRQCVVEIHRRLEHLLFIHRSPMDALPVITQEDEPFETQLMNLPSEAVYQIVQRRFNEIYIQLDHYILKGSIRPSPSTVISSKYQETPKATTLQDHFLQC